MAAEVTTSGTGRFDKVQESGEAMGAEVRCIEVLVDECGELSLIFGVEEVVSGVAVEW